MFKVMLKKFKYLEITCINKFNHILNMYVVLMQWLTCTIIIGENVTSSNIDCNLELHLNLNEKIYAGLKHFFEECEDYDSQI